MRGSCMFSYVYALVFLCSSVIFCSYMFLSSYVQHTYPVSIYKFSIVFSRFAFVYICVRSQALLMPCLVCGQWMGPAGAPPRFMCMAPMRVM